MAQIAAIFGYLLNYIYSFCNNYGISIIIFTIILKFSYSLGSLLPVDQLLAFIYLFE